jgi:hypothetical protein
MSQVKSKKIVKKRQDIYWVRQNPFMNTDQDAMYNLITNRSIVTVPFGHSDDYKTNCIVVESMNADMAKTVVPINWESNSQDKEFFNLPCNSIIVIFFRDMQKTIVAQLMNSGNECVVYKDTDMYVHSNGIDKEINTVKSIHPFEPLCRTIKILGIIPKIYRGRINTFGKIKKKSDLYNDVMQILQNSK